MQTVTLMLLAAALLAAQDRPNKGAPAKDAPAKDAPARKDTGSRSAPQALPSGAVQIEQGLYRYTDAKGKTWMYRRTPFGWSTWEDKPDTRPAAEETNPVVATDLGDSVRFERKTPFGTNHWIRKKSELTPEEQAIFAGRKPVPAPASEPKAPPTAQNTETK
ncbi:MAG TPA: hypothetical protein VEV17_04330 [Bryobacteraceae bacterium]|nr:hypothetical protein [Bryobacteraceae bacterium]